VTDCGVTKLRGGRALRSQRQAIPASLGYQDHLGPERVIDS